jgi:hypothetical protein
MRGTRGRWWVVGVAAVLCAAASLGCGKNDPFAPPTDRVRVLFIGNSLTYGNDLPLIVEELAEAAGEKPLEAVDISQGNTALSDHWFHGLALEQIRKGGWNVVVLQQGPSALEANRDSLRMFTQRFAAEIRKVGARPALYMVWPEQRRFFDYDRAVESYTLAAQDVNGMLFPGGEAMRLVRERDETLPLLASDGYHPSELGSYLVALTMFGIIYDRPPVGLPARLELRSGRTIAMPGTTAALLQSAAADANERFGRR